MDTDEKHVELRRITWRLIATCKNVMIALPQKARVTLLEDVTRAEEDLGRFGLGEDGTDGKASNTRR